MITNASSPNLADVLAKAQLPALPQSAVRLLKLSQDPKNGPHEFSQVIEADPGLTGQVLRFVNSSYFGFSRQIPNVKLAITLVGVRTIKNFVLWSAVFSAMPNPKCGALDLKSLWQDSLRRAIFARAVGKLMGLKDAEDLFASALLQDMAIPLLAKELPRQYQQLLEARQASDQRLSCLEREMLGWTHAEAAGLLAQKWSLPESFVRMVSAHALLAELLAQSEKSVELLAVALSSHLPAVGDRGWSDGDFFCSTYDQLCGSRQSLAATLENVDNDYEQFAPVLQLATPPVSLSQRLAELVTRTGQR